MGPGGPPGGGGDNDRPQQQEPPPEKCRKHKKPTGVGGGSPGDDPPDQGGNANGDGSDSSVSEAGVLGDLLKALRKSRPSSSSSHRTPKEKIHIPDLPSPSQFAAWWLAVRVAICASVPSEAEALAKWFGDLDDEHEYEFLV